MNLLVTGAFDWNETELNLLRSLGHKVIFMQQENSQLPCTESWIEGIIGNGIFLHHPIEHFTSLRFIQLTSAGFDRVPIEYINEHNIKISNARGVYSIPMSEFAIGGVLQLYKQSGYFKGNQIKHKWEKHRGLLELYQKNVCIIGCGSVGNECAKRFKSFECCVVGIDIAPYQNDLYDMMLSLDQLNDALSNADITVISLPLTQETHHLINAERLSLMKQGCVLVNIARGAVVDTDAMITALQTNLRGAVLDVFEDEPLNKDSVLWDLDNVIITPHNSFVSEGNHNRMLEVIMRNLEGIVI